MCICVIYLSPLSEDSAREQFALVNILEKFYLQNESNGKQIVYTIIVCYR